MRYLLIPVCLILLTTAVSISDDTELFVLKNAPDLLILFDTSGSMTWDMLGTATYGDGSNRYWGRDTNGDGLSNDARIYICKNALYTMFDNVENVRWGMARFLQYKQWTWFDSWYQQPWSEERGWWHYSISWPYNRKAYEAFDLLVTIAEGTPSHINALKTWIDQNPSNWQSDKELKAQGGTPIPGALRGARYHYIDIIPTDNARWCRRYFVLLITDGEPTYKIDPATYNQGKNAWWGDYGQDVVAQRQSYWEAESLRHSYIPPHGNDPEQEIDIQTYVIGIGISSATLDSIAARGGTEHYYPANDPKELEEALNSIIADILQKAFSFTTPSIPYLMTRGGNKLYMASMFPQYSAFWKGYLRCYPLDSTGYIPTDSLGIPTIPPLWEAGAQLQGADPILRNMMAVKGGGLVPFDAGHITPADLGVSTAAERDSIIGFVRGDTLYNKHDWKLGDIFHSSPKLIAAFDYMKLFFWGEPMADSFIDAIKNLDRVIVVGANDGQVHAFDAGHYMAVGDSFDAGTGDELWSIIPNQHLPRLQYLLGTEHKWFADGHVYPAIYNYMVGPNIFWKRIAMVGDRRGGNRYIFIDITDPQNPSYDGEFSDPMLAETWSKPSIWKINVQGYPDNKCWAAFFGGGFDSTFANGKSFFILDPHSMAVLKTFLGFDGPIPGGCEWLDVDNDLRADYLYVGDMDGSVYRISLTDPNPTNWAYTKLFDAPNPQGSQPMYYRPSIGQDSSGRYWICIGAGDRNHPMDLTTNHRFYAFRDFDTTLTYPLNENDLINAKVSICGPTDPGWYYPLEKGEKCLAASEIFENIVYFTTFIPTSDTTDLCVAAGKGRIYERGLASGKSQLPGEYQEIPGGGIPSEPQINVTPEGNMRKYVGSGGGGIYIQPPIPGVFGIDLIRWRELTR
ncbi:MAG TPA: hypothetical protein EYP58_00985 [bacterium (Candidatus Stahlbacteria)]|nr:hypothetical protein [Candidatus Stahlbacteria bacterium]